MMRDRTSEQISAIPAEPSAQELPSVVHDAEFQGATNLNASGGFNAKVAAFAISGGYVFERYVTSSEAHRSLCGIAVDDFLDSRLAHSPLGRLTGFSTWENSDTRRVYRKVPDTSTLNQQMDRFRAATNESHDGVFVGHSDGTLSYPDMAQHFAQREIPVATEGDELIHDSLLHVAGFASMHKDLFALIVGASQTALETAQPEDFERAILLAEFLSGLLSNAGGGALDLQKLTQAFQNAKLPVDQARRMAEENLDKQNAHTEKLLGRTAAKRSGLGQFLGRLLAS